MGSGIGAMELLLLVLMSSAGQPTDLALVVSPRDYFQTQGVDTTFERMLELAAKDPVDGPTQFAQLLALRALGEDSAFKKAANYAAGRQVIEAIAAGKTGQDKLGFAKEYALRTLALLDDAQAPAPSESASGMASATLSSSCCLS